MENQFIISRRNDLEFNAALMKCLGVHSITKPGELLDRIDDKENPYITYYLSSETSNKLSEPDIELLKSFGYKSNP